MPKPLPYSQSLPHSVGLAFGGFLGLWHSLWAMLVALDLAEPLINYILRLHFLDVSYRLFPFDIGTALMLVIVTSVFGYVIGAVAGCLFGACRR